MCEWIYMCVCVLQSKVLPPLKAWNVFAGNKFVCRIKSQKLLLALNLPLNNYPYRHHYANSIYIYREREEEEDQLFALVFYFINLLQKYFSSNIYLPRFYLLFILQTLYTNIISFFINKCPFFHFPHCMALSHHRSFFILFSC